MLAISVTTTADIVDEHDGKTSLREAISQANDSSTAEEIVLPSGIYEIGSSLLDERRENANAKGDFDITNTNQTITIRGAGIGQTTIDAKGYDRVFDVRNNASLVLEDVTVTGGVGGTHSSDDEGGGVRIYFGTGELNDVEITDNEAKFGGGLYFYAPSGGSLSISGSDITNNEATVYYGGGAYLYSPYSNVSMDIDSTTISSNTASSSGGGFYHQSSGTLDIVNSSVDSNVAGGTGGGFYNRNGDVTISSSAIIDNETSSSSGGGGIYDRQGDLTLENTTVSGNSTGTGSGSGGAIYAYVSQLDLLNSTITNNSGSRTGGIYAVSVSTFNLKNSILWGNSSTFQTTTYGQDYYGSIDSLGYNMLTSPVGSSSITGTTTGNQLNTDPDLGTLQLNGGSTKNHLPNSTGPAIDAGTNTGAPSTDQRGVGRPVDGDADSTATVDIGAVEYEPAPPNNPPTAVNDSASVSEDSTANAISVLANDSIAPDVGETLTITATSSFTQGGSATISGSQVLYTPDDDFFGTETFSYTISDGNGGTDSATVQVTVNNVNDDPQAVNDSATVSEDSTSNAINVVTNDLVSPDTGETLTVVGVSGFSNGGTATISANQLLYKPATDYSGIESFNYTIEDGNGGVSHASVQVTVTSGQDAPLALDDIETTNLEQAVSVAVLNNDVEIDSTDTLSIASISQGTSGSTIISGSEVIYTPNTGFSGTDSFTYTVSDGNGGSDTATVTVSVDSLPDIRAVNLSGDGTDLIIEYEISEDALGEFKSGVFVGLYASFDGSTPDQFLTHHKIATAGEVINGTHTVSFQPEFEDLDEDYYLMASLDFGENVNEIDETNNQVILEMGTFKTTSGITHYHGNQFNQSITIADLTTPTISVSPGAVKLHDFGIPALMFPYYDVNSDGYASMDDANLIIDYILADPAGQATFLADNNLVAGGAPWTSTTNPLDVEDSGTITTLDALTIVSLLRNAESDYSLLSDTSEIRLRLHGGDDTVVSGDPSEGESIYNRVIAFGGAGDDTLTGGGGNDSLYGGEGNDLVEGRTGLDYLASGTGTSDMVSDGVGQSLEVSAASGVSGATPAASIAVKSLFGNQVVIDLRQMAKDEGFDPDNVSYANAEVVDPVSSGQEKATVTLDAGNSEATIEVNRNNTNVEMTVEITDNATSVTRTAAFKVQQVDLVQNGSFEADASALPKPSSNPLSPDWRYGGDTRVYLDAFDSWNEVGGSNYSELQKDSHYSGFSASNGSHWAELHSFPHDPVNDANCNIPPQQYSAAGKMEIAQDITTEDGKDYVLSFDFSNRPDIAANYSELQVVVSDTASSTTLHTDDVSSSSGGWINNRYEFTAQGETTRISFTDIGDDKTSTEAKRLCTGEFVNSSGTIISNEEGELLEEYTENDKYDVTVYNMVGTLLDNVTLHRKEPVTLSIDDVEVVEGAQGVDKTATFTVTLSNKSDEDITVDYTTSDGTALTGDDDYETSTGTLTISAGASQGQIDVIVNGDDNDDEGDEHYYVELSNPTYATLVTDRGTGTILDDSEGGEIKYKKTYDKYSLCSCACSVCLTSGSSVEASDGSFVLSVVSTVAELPRYFSEALQNTKPIFTAAMNMADNALSAVSAQAKVNVGGLDQPAQNFDTSNLASGKDYQLSLQADAAPLSEGKHDVKAEVTYEYANGETKTETIEDTFLHIDLSQSPFGEGFWLPSLDRLTIHEDGVATLRGDNTASWFADDGSGGYTTPEGSFSELEYGTFGGQLGYRLTTKWGERADYNPAGQLIKRIDRYDNETLYNYTGSLLTSIVDPNGRQTTYHYNGRGLLSQVTDFAGRVTQYEYSGRKLTKVIHPDPDGPTGPLESPEEVFTYQVAGLAFGSGQLASHLDAEGRLTTYEYGYDGRLESTTKPDGSVWTIDHIQRQALPTDSNGTPSNPAPLLYPNENPNSTRAVFTDGRGNQTFYETDDFGNMTRMIDALGNDYQFVRDANGQLVQTIEPDPDDFGPGNDGPLDETLDIVTDYGSYDANGNLSSITFPDPNDTATQQFEYDTNFGVLTKFTDELGRVVKYDVDPLNGNVDSMTQVVGLDDDSSSETDDIEYVYTYTEPSDPVPAGMISTITDPLGRVTRYRYYESGNSLGWLKSITYAEGTGDEATETFVYDKAGNLAGFQDGEYNFTTYAYDRLDRLVGMKEADPDPLDFTDGDHPITTYTYDKVHNLRTITDAEGVLTELVYDPINRLKQQVNASGSADESITDYAFDLNGNLARMTDPIGRSTSYVYDELNRPTQIRQPNPGDGATDTLIDNTSPNFDTETSGGGADSWSSVSSAASYNGDYVYNNTANTGDKAIWSATGLTSGDVYEVWVTWGADASYQPNAPYTVSHGTTTESEVTFDQTVAPQSTDDAVEIDGVWWVKLGDYEITDSSLDVTLTQPASAAPVSADAVLVRPLTVTRFVYDNVGNIHEVFDAEGNNTSYRYDERHRQISLLSADPDGTNPGADDLLRPLTQYEYDIANQLLEVQDNPDRYLATHAALPLNRVVSYAYDDLGRMVSMTEPDPDGGGSLTSPITVYVYDDVGNRKSVTDPLEKVTEYEFDDRDRLTMITQEDPDDGGPLSAPVSKFTYDDANRMLTSTDPLSRTTSFDYDNLNRLTTLTQPDPDGAGSLVSPVVSYTYDKVGNQLTMTDPLESVTTYDYDDLYRMTTLTEADPDGVGSLTSPVTIYTFDAAGQLTSMTDPESRTTSYQYDDLGRRTKLTQPDPDGAGSATAPDTLYGYDLVGNLTSMTDPNTHVTTYGYDNLYRQTSMTNANSETTSFSFDSLGNMLSLTDPESNTTEWEYDGLNRTIIETITLDSTEVDRTYTYDPVGNLTEKVDRNGRKTTYSYDNIYQLDQEKWYDLSQSLVNTIDYDYNEIGELDSVTDGSSSSTYDYLYDDLGRTTQSLFTFDSRTAQFDYEYDVASNMTSKFATLDSTLDFENTYGYDDLHRLTSFTQTGQTGGNTVADKHVTLAYNKASQRTDLLRYADDEVNPANLVIDTTYSHDLIGRLTQIDHTDGTSTIHKFDFTYDPASRIDTLTSSVDGVQDYGYDDTNQLTSVEDGSQTSLEDYSYDDNGNRTNTGYTTGDYNRLTSDGTFDYEYDNEGNRIRRVHSTTGATTVYHWDHRNRLTAVIDYANETDADADLNRTQTVEHQYDAFNQWIAKSVDADGDGAGAAVDEFYIHDDGQIGFRLDDSGDIENRYVWDPTAVDQLWADEAISDELRWSLTDHLGSVHDLVDNAGNVDKHIEYDSFGNVTADSAAALDLLFGYTSRPFDDETQLQNNLNRWYDAMVGIWISEDPIAFHGRDVNLFRAVHNNPISARDPKGLRIEHIGGTAADHARFNTILNMLINTPLNPASCAAEFILKRDKVFKVRWSKEGPHAALKYAAFINLTTGSPTFLPSEFDLASADLQHGSGRPFTPNQIAVIVLGHEIGHAVLKLRDPTTNNPNGGNVTLCENPLRTAMGLPVMRDDYDNQPVPDKENAAKERLEFFFEYMWPEVDWTWELDYENPGGMNFVPINPDLTVE